MSHPTKPSATRGSAAGSSNNVTRHGRKGGSRVKGWPRNARGDFAHSPVGSPGIGLLIDFLLTGQRSNTISITRNIRDRVRVIVLDASLNSFTVKGPAHDTRDPPRLHPGHSVLPTDTSGRALSKPPMISILGLFAIITSSLLGNDPGHPLHVNHTKFAQQMFRRYIIHPAKKSPSMHTITNILPTVVL